MEKFKNIEKEKLRKKEMAKLKKFLAPLPKDKMKMAEGLIQQAGFMYATLFELQSILDRDGPVENFEQGKQKMLREHPASKTYNSMIRNYASVVKQLCDLLPKEDAKEAKDELMEFVKKARK